jgi:hypothetical protein
MMVWASIVLWKNLKPRSSVESSMLDRASAIRLLATSCSLVALGDMREPEGLAASVEMPSPENIPTKISAASISAGVSFMMGMSFMLLPVTVLTLEALDLVSAANTS